MDTDSQLEIKLSALLKRYTRALSDVVPKALIENAPVKQNNFQNHKLVLLTDPQIEIDITRIINYKHMFVNISPERPQIEIETANPLPLYFKLPGNPQIAANKYIYLSIADYEKEWIVVPPHNKTKL